MAKNRKVELSERERQLVKLAAEGHTDASIAHRLGISEATVSTYWGRVRIKVGPFSRPELIATIIRQELGEIVETLREENRQLIEELQKQAGKEWGAPEVDYYHKLVLGAPDAILIVKENGDLESVNDECARLFGYERSEIEGKNLQLLIPERYQKVHTQHREDYMEHPVKRKMAEHMASLARCKDGSELSIAAALSPVETKSGLRVMCIVRIVEHDFIH